MNVLFDVLEFRLLCVHFLTLVEDNERRRITSTTRASTFSCVFCFVKLRVLCKLERRVDCDNDNNDNDDGDGEDDDHDDEDDENNEEDADADPDDKARDRSRSPKSRIAGSSSRQQVRHFERADYAAVPRGPPAPAKSRGRDASQRKQTSPVHVLFEQLANEGDVRVFKCRMCPGNAGKYRVNFLKFLLIFINSIKAATRRDVDWFAVRSFANSRQACRRTRDEAQCEHRYDSRYC